VRVAHLAGGCNQAENSDRFWESVDQAGNPILCLHEVATVKFVVYAVEKICAKFMAVLASNKPNLFGQLLEAPPPEPPSPFEILFFTGEKLQHQVRYPTTHSLTIAIFELICHFNHGMMP